MGRLKRRGTRMGNRIGVWMYRTLDGRLASGSKKVHLLMITTPGRRTGLPRATCVRYLETPEGFVVWGTGSGSPRDPDWFQNLRTASVADVQVGARRLTARPRELLGEERDRTWNELVLARAPEVAKYARRGRPHHPRGGPRGSSLRTRLLPEPEGVRYGHNVPVLMLSRTDVEALVDLDALRGALRPAMQDVSSGRVSMPARIAAIVPSRGLLAAMPAYVPTGGGLMTKLVSLFPGNAGTSLPTHQAVVIVFDTESGEPVALLDGTSITTLRTAAGSALSAELLSRADAKTLAVLGTGVQARAHAEAMMRVRPIQQIRVAGRNRDRAGSLASVLRETLGVEARAVDTYGEACADADLVCATTHSPVPVVEREFLKPGVHVTSVGYNTEGREVDSATVVDALVVVESVAAVLAPPPAGCNDLRLPIDEGLIEPGHIHAEIGELLLDTKAGRTAPDQITLYKSVGVAAQDAAAADLVLTAARRRGLGFEIEVSG